MQSQSTAQIPLRARDGSIRAYAIVDAADADAVNAYGPWSLTRNGYVAHGSTYLHRFLLGLRSANRFEVDHIDHDRKNCRRVNLRIVTRAQNNQNMPSQAGTSLFRGVCWYKTKNKWLAYIEIRGKREHLGYFENELDAAETAILMRLEFMPYARN